MTRDFITAVDQSEGYWGALLLKKLQPSSVQRWVQRLFGQQGRS
ncbi:MAG: hypothetical protein ROO73_03815 [Roseivirga sp.]